MAQKNMFKKLVFYLEACESGSMFQGLLPTNINVYATTAASATESSWGTYCPPNDMINGKHMGSCLGDLYSVVWMEDTDKMGPKESLADQFVTVKKLTTQSHCQQYGDVSWLNLPIGAFQGQIDTEVSTPVVETPVDVAASAARGDVMARDIPMHLAYYQYLRADRTDLASSHEAARALLQHVNERIATDNTFLKIAGSFVGVERAQAFLNRPSVDASECGACCEAGHSAVFDHCGGYSEYGMTYIKVVNNLCSLASNEPNFQGRLVSTIRNVCTPIITA
jgi:legumain